MHPGASRLLATSSPPLPRCTPAHLVYEREFLGEAVKDAARRVGVEEGERRAQDAEECRVVERSGSGDAALEEGHSAPPADDRCGNDEACGEGAVMCRGKCGARGANAPAYRAG